MTAPERRRPVVAALYREALPPRLAEVEKLAEVRLTKADGLAEALNGADVLYQWHSFSPALRENWGAASYSVPSYMRPPMDEYSPSLFSRTIQ